MLFKVKHKITGETLTVLHISAQFDSGGDIIHWFLCVDEQNNFVRCMAAETTYCKKKVRGE
nr:hypothetical protein DGKKSRWO_DGKKSRWO_CDS_0130 [uncultured phage]CAI9752307.1 hypothetical protein CVNMHQAP_CVNMHQAP_CDS_0130 [uncultured phage]